jgi:hypothetical protein
MRLLAVIGIKNYGYLVEVLHKIGNLEALIPCSLLIMGIHFSKVAFWSCLAAPTLASKVSSFAMRAMSMKVFLSPMLLTIYILVEIYVTWKEEILGSTIIRCGFGSNHGCRCHGQMRCAACCVRGAPKNHARRFLRGLVNTTQKQRSSLHE